MTFTYDNFFIIRLIDFWYRQRLNFKSFIQLFEILSVEIISWVNWNSYFFLSFNYTPKS